MKFAGQGGYESYHTAFRIKPEFASEFDQFKYPYEDGRKDSNMRSPTTRSAASTT